MFTLGSKALVINQASLVTVNGNLLSVPGFGTIDKTAPGYTKVKTAGIAPTYSSVDLAAAGFVAGKEIAVYWQSLRYIGDGVANMSSKPQQPLCIIWPASDASLTSIEKVWENRQEGLGISTLFNVTGTTLTSLNTAVNIVSTSIRDIIVPSERWDKPESGFMYGGFGGIETTPGTLVSGSEGIGNGTQVEESVLTDNVDITDPYSTRAHGSQQPILKGIYDIYDFTVPYMGTDWRVNSNLGEEIPDQDVVNKLIHLRIYALQADASLPIDSF